MKWTKYIFPLFLLLVMAAVAFFSVGIAVPTVQRTSIRPRTVPVADTRRQHQVSDEWGDDAFEADFYPSQRAAAKHLSQRFVADLATMVKEKPSVIRITGPASISREAYEGLKSKLQLQFPRAQCRINLTDVGSLRGIWAVLAVRASEGVRAASQAANTPAGRSITMAVPTLGSIPTPAIINAIREQLPPTDDILDKSTPLVSPKELEVLLGLEGMHSEASASSIPRTLTIECVGAATLSKSVSYYEKLWADDFLAFKNQKPKGTWIVARSSSPAATPAEAAAEARHSAAESLRKLVRERAPKDRLRWDDEGNEWLKEKLEKDLREDLHIADKFEQRFDRTYAIVFREALLVDVSSDTIKKLSNDYASELNKRRETWQHVIFSVGGLFALVYVLYLFVNSATRGYFVWRLRTTATLLAFVGALLVFYFILG